MVKTSKQGIKQDAKGRFLPGHSGNPGGRPSGPSKALAEIQNAIIEFEKEKGVSYWKAATLIAMKLANEGNTNLLAKILDKFVPSKILNEGGEQQIVYVINNGNTKGREGNRVDLLPAHKSAEDKV